MTPSTLLLVSLPAAMPARYDASSNANSIPATFAPVRFPEVVI